MFQFTLPDPLVSLKSSCEVHCVAGCCGLGAFEVKSWHIEPWISDNGVPKTTEALTQLEELCHVVARKRGRVGSTQDDFGDAWKTPSDCLDYLELFQRETVQALLTTTGGHLFQPAWMSANSQAVRSIVRDIESTRDFDLLPILGDALEEAGCPVETLVGHCRQNAGHARRCWLVDLLSAGEGMVPHPPTRNTLPRRNRVTPFGDLIATAARGTLMGNRGRLHDDGQRIVRDHAGRRWLLCRLSFRGRKRPIMAPGKYTELFFLDEATGLAAGHRPCAECQRDRFIAFRDAFSRGNEHLRGGATLAADDIDLLLDAQRHPPGRSRSLWEAALDDLPEGTMVLPAGHDRSHLVQARQLLPWYPDGYGPGIVRSRGLRLLVLTPAATVNAIRAGYTVAVHPTATVR
jgi:hypothetical protein